jgi:hypothetical protein
MRAAAGRPRHRPGLARRRSPDGRGRAAPVAADRDGAAGRGYGRGGTCWSDQVLPSGSLKVTNEPHG